MRPNFSHPASSSMSWQHQQRNKGPLVVFPCDQHHHQHHHQKQQHSGFDEGTTAFQCSRRTGGVSNQQQFELMNMDSSSPSNTNYKEGEEIDDNLVLEQRSDSSDARQRSGIMMTMEKEHMFDKVVTPSDVGKLNRLVIPKQHAEKYFPLDSSTNEKGLLLNFEDRNGKPWRFRYSYWNSSQSYVMTKGWSRFVKDKKLDAGDIVSFSRGVGELGKDRLFIDWRRRLDVPPLPPPTSAIPGHHQYLSFHHPWNNPSYLQQQRYRDHVPTSQLVNAMNAQSHNYTYGGLMNGSPCPGSLIYVRPQQQMVPAGGVGIGMIRGGGAIDADDPMVFESVPVVQGKAAAKKLRLFGVNMECPVSEGSGLPPETEIILSSTAVPALTMAANPLPSHFSSSSSSSSASLTRPYLYTGAPLLQKMSSDKILNKGKGSLSLNFDV